MGTESTSAHGRIPVLDNGYVECVDVWGSDESIIEAARMSVQRGFEGWGTDKCIHCGITPEDATNRGMAGDQCPDGEEHKWDIGDRKLLRYLWEHKHATPFEMGGVVIEVQAPIFVFREWHRHRTQSYNEASARYEPLPDVNYIPTVERLMMNAGGTNKQAGTVKEADVLTEKKAREFINYLVKGYDSAQITYEDALSSGVPKELARLCLPVGRYSKMRASANVRNWLGFLTLRMDKAAQWEIRQFANAVGQIVEEKFPRTWALFAEGLKP